jgi:hypothetical protein
MFADASKTQTAGLLLLSPTVCKTPWVEDIVIRVKSPLLLSVLLTVLPPELRIMTIIFSAETDSPRTTFSLCLLVSLIPPRECLQLRTLFSVNFAIEAPLKVVLAKVAIKPLRQIPLTVDLSLLTLLA